MIPAPLRPSFTIAVTGGVRALALVGLISAACSAEAIELAKYSVVDYVVRYEVDKSGDKVETVKRIAVRNAKIVEVGKTTFLTGASALDDKVIIAGSQFNAVLIPVERIISVCSYSDPLPLVKSQLSDIACGVDVKK